MKLISLFFFMALSGLGAHAGSQSYTSDFKSAALSIPESLLQAGYKSIGKVNLRNIVKNVENLQIEERPWVETAVGDQRRIFARWEVAAKGPKVIINTSTWGQAFPQHHGTLALHEILGAHGFSDEDYNLSTALWLLSTDSQKKVMTKEERRYVENKVSQLAAVEGSGGGGIIGVGGGGDMMGPALKLTMLEQAYKEYDQDRSEERRAGVFYKFRVTQMFNVEGTWKKR